MPAKIAGRTNAPRKFPKKDSKSSNELGATNSTLLKHIIITII